jgi:hypothetical protein
MLSSNLKGILGDVRLDGKILKNWTACLTSNFIPNYQKNVKEENFNFISRLKNKNRLMSNIE